MTSTLPVFSIVTSKVNVPPGSGSDVGVAVLATLIVSTFGMKSRRKTSVNAVPSTYSLQTTTNVPPVLLPAVAGPLLCSWSVAPLVTLKVGP